MQFTLKAPINISQDKDWYYCECLPFDVHSQGRTEKEAKNNIIEAMQLFLESCFKRGTFEQVLKDCEIHTVHREHPLSKKSSTQHMIDVPLSLLVADRVKENRTY